MSLPCLKSSEFPLALRTSFECLVCCTEHPSSRPPSPSTPPLQPVCRTPDHTPCWSEWLGLFVPLLLGYSSSASSRKLSKIAFCPPGLGASSGNSSHPTKILPVCPLEPLKGRGCPFPVLLSAQSSEDQPVSPLSSQRHLPSFLPLTP